MERQRRMAIVSAGACLAILGTMSSAIAQPWDVTTLMGGSAFVHLPEGSVPEGILALAPGETHASFICAVQEPPFPFVTALPSWNGHASPRSGFRVAVRIRSDAAGDWSPWLEVGNWGGFLPDRAGLATESSTAWVDIDTLKLRIPAREYVFRVDMVRLTSTDPSPSLHRIGMCVTSQDPATGAIDEATQSDSVGAMVIPAPFRGQITTNPALTGRICSPCTVASALGAYGIDVPTETVADALYDPEHQIYGVWPRAIQGAAEYGVDGYVTRIRTWSELRRHLAAGRVIGASIRFGPGTLKHPPYPSTSGHLILLRGMTPEGDIITNDSYRAKDGDGKVWAREDLAKAWFGTGGVAYVFERPAAHQRP